jgi:hypothetical protein
MLTYLCSTLTLLLFPAQRDSLSFALHPLLLLTA